MQTGTTAFQTTGMPVGHGPAIQEVADRTGHAIIFRSVGKQSTRLLEEGYAAKGFRIDTKSCDWGPMRGFVCVDPRLSKVGGDDAKATANRTYTAEALGGRIRHDAVGGLAGVRPDAVLVDWMAGCKPVVISRDRYEELMAAGLGGLTNGDGVVRGVASDASGRVRLPWALVPTRECERVLSYRAVCGELPPGGYGVFIDGTNRTLPFAQDLPASVNAPRVLGFQAILGLTNPGTDDFGYKACVTGDYDLFAVWPPAPKLDPFAQRNWDVRIVDRYKQLHPGTRVAHHHQHFKLGNITGRIDMVKVLLNTAFIGKSKYPGGNLVHHSDEVGNPSPGLKKTLRESFPLLAFLPREGWRTAGLAEAGLCLTNTLDFSDFVKMCQQSGVVPQLRQEWGNFADVQKTPATTVGQRRGR